MQPIQSRVHFDDIEYDEMYASSEGEEKVDEAGKGNRIEDVNKSDDHGVAAQKYQMRMNSQDEDVNMSTDEVVGTRGKEKENKASGFSAFSSILAQCSSKDSTTEKTFCTSRRRCAS